MILLILLTLLILIRLSAGLGFFSKGKQALYVGLKCGFGVRNFSIWRGIAHVLIVECPCVSFGAVKVDFPSNVEFCFAPIGQALPEVGNYGLQFREDGMQFVVNGVPITWPVSRLWVQPLENAKDVGSERFGGSLKSDIPLQLEAAKDRNKGGDQDESGSGWDYLQAAILGVLLVCVPMIPVFMQKPN